MIFRQLFHAETFSFTYIIGSEKTKEAIVIDPVSACFERDKKLLIELGLNLKYILETHTHIDHISGAFYLKEAFPKALTVLPEFYGSNFVDINVTEADIFIIGEIYLKTIFTPGHTGGSVSYYTKGKLFTGDSLLIRSCGRTDQHGGNSDALYDSVINKIMALPDDTFVYPGHDYNGYLFSTIGEEKLFNPLFAGISKEEFKKLMKDNLPEGNTQTVVIKENCNSKISESTIESPELITSKS